MADKPGTPPVVILCGGKGRRFTESIRKERGEHALGFDDGTLDELSKTPKVLTPVGGDPLLEHVLRSFAVQGFNNFIMLTGHQEGMIQSHFTKPEFRGWDIQYHNPNDIGQSIVDYLIESKDKLGEPLIVANGDALSDTNMTRFLAEHRSEDSTVSVNALGRGFKPFAGVTLIHPRLLDANWNTSLGKYVSKTPSAKPSTCSVDGGYYELTKNRLTCVFDGVEDLHYVRTLRDYRDLTRAWDSGKASWPGAYDKHKPGSGRKRLRV